jgi:hypothetical protein
LLSGTWKQALDELRKKKYHEEKDDRVRVQVIRRPRGAECDREILDSIFGSIFIKDQYLYTEAKRYILGHDPGQLNPIQAFEDAQAFKDELTNEDSSDSDLSDN